MTKHHWVNLFAVLAVALSLASLVIVAAVATRGGVVRWIAVVVPFVVLVGAGSRLLKFRRVPK